MNTDEEIIEWLIAQKQLDRKGKGLLKSIIIKYIDSGFTMCNSCDAQVRAAHKRLLKWYNLKNEGN